jgi:hypothetical protein
MRCIVCGKELADGDKAVSFQRGSWKESSAPQAMDIAHFEPAKAIGISHDACFEQSVSSPQLVLSKIKKLAKPSKKTT